MDSPLSTEIKSTMITQEENDNVSMLSLSNNIISNNLFDIQFFDLEEPKDSYNKESVYNKLNGTQYNTLMQKLGEA